MRIIWAPTAASEESSPRVPRHTNFLCRAAVVWMDGEDEQILELCEKKMIGGFRRGEEGGKDGNCNVHSSPTTLPNI